MSAVNIKIRHPRFGPPLTVAVTPPSPSPCCGCGAIGRLRCCVCQAWYCTAFCQGSDWPNHRSYCVHPPALLWPDGVRYLGEEEVVAMNKGEEVEPEHENMMTINNFIDENDAIKKSVIINGSVIDKKMNKTDKVTEHNGNCVRVGSKQNFRERIIDDMKLSQEFFDSEDNHLTLTGEVISRSSPSSTNSSPSIKFDQPSVSDVVDISVLPPPQTNKTGPAQMPAVNLMIQKNGIKPPGSAEDLVAEHSDITDSEMMTILDVTTAEKDVEFVKEQPKKAADVSVTLSSYTEPAVISKWQSSTSKTFQTIPQGRDVVDSQLGTTGATLCITETEGNSRVDDVTLKENDITRSYLDADEATSITFSPEVVEFASLVHESHVSDPIDMVKIEKVMSPVEMKLEVPVEKNMSVEDLVQSASISLVHESPVGDPADMVKTEKVMSPEEIKGGVPVEKKLSVEDLVQPVKVQKGSLSLGSKMMAVVCHLETPLVFYICPATSVEDFANIFTLSQDCPPGLVCAIVGNCCLVQDNEDDCWYRGEITRVEDHKVILFLLDSGKTLSSSIHNLRPLTKDLASVKGLVSKVNLKGVKSKEDSWSTMSIDKAMHILDVGNDVTMFKVKVVKVDSKGELYVVMKNTDGRDIASVMVDAGIVTPEMNAGKAEGEKVSIRFNLGTLPKGLQSALILKMVSPMELYLCTVDKFLEMENSMAMLEKAAVTANVVTTAVRGDPVLACDDGTWYRAKVTDVMSDSKVQVELVDIASCSTLHLSQLRKPSSDIMKGEVTAVSCCLESWVNEDRLMAKEQWESKVSTMVEFYEEIQVDVVGHVQGQLIIRMPELEKKFTRDPKSVAELIKERTMKQQL